MENISTLVLISVGTPGIVLILIALIIYLVLKNKEKSCTAETVGHVIKYTSYGGGNVFPILEYTVDGVKYTVRRKFRAVITKSIQGVIPTVREKPAYVDANDCLVIETGNMTNIRKIAEETWPLGSEMKVFYNPKNPKSACAERFPKLPSLMTKLFFGVGIFVIVIALILFVVL